MGPDALVSSDRTGTVKSDCRCSGETRFHMLFLAGVYAECPDGALTFRWVKAPTTTPRSPCFRTAAS